MSKVSKAQSNPGDGDDQSAAGSAPIGAQTTVLDLAMGGKYDDCQAAGPSGDLSLGTEHDVDPFARNFS